MNRFAQFHLLTSYPASLLNRDDAGFAKRIHFGSASRIRISSQCLKRHWRTFDGEGSFLGIDGVEPSIRSRMTFNEYLLKPLIESGVSEVLAKDIVSAIMANVLGKSDKTKSKEKDKDAEASANTLKTKQLTVLGRPEANFLLDAAKTLASQVGADDDSKAVKAACKDFFDKEQRKNLQALRAGCGFDAALFGRMVTSDILSREDAAVHVAHAITVHGEESEPDYFTAVDDILGTDDEGESETAHLNTTELTSGLYYLYVVVDLPQLVSNIEGTPQAEWTNADLTTSKEVLKRLPRILATVSPGAKKGSTAPYAYAHMVLSELGSTQPRTLANAFLKPVRANGDLAADAYSALAVHLEELDGVYGVTTERFGAALGDKSHLASIKTEWGTIDQVGDWVAATLGD